MPIYEYHCEACASDFELLIQGSAEPVCPDCESRELTKKWSAFAAGGSPAPSASAGHAHGGGCGCCGGGQMGSCGLN